MAFDSVAEIILRLRSRFPVLDKRIRESAALSAWEQTVGPSIAKHSRAIQVKDQVLWIEVTHPAWRAEIHYRKAQILERLNRAAKEGQLGHEKTPNEQPWILDLQLTDPRSRPLSWTQKRSAPSLTSASSVGPQDAHRARDQKSDQDDSNKS